MVDRKVLGGQEPFMPQEEESELEASSGVSCTPSSVTGPPTSSRHRHVGSPV